jgi:hypothetical protein
VHVTRFDNKEEAMIRSRGRARLGVLLAMALGIVAIFALPAVASAKDRNHDRIPDRWEKRHNLSLAVNQARKDQDRDHLRNLAEFKAGDNPRSDDSDGDGIMDGEENAGTITSFDAESGKLMIALFGNETISGLVTEQTEIKCEGVDSGSSAATSSSDESEPGDDNGGGEEPGDDNGGDSGTGSTNSGSGGSDDNGEGGTCTSADLIPGAVVQQAELELGNGTATFHEVELAHTTG